MTKAELFKEATKKLTYWDVAQAFYSLNDILRGEYYSSSKDLITPSGEHVPGFIYTGYAAGAGIRRILDSLKMKYITHIKKGSGTEEESEIYIEDPESKKRFLDILEKCVRFDINFRIEPNTMIDNRTNPLFQHIR